MEKSHHPVVEGGVCCLAKAGPGLEVKREWADFWLL
jgi:hypothetical protein